MKKVICLLLLITVMVFPFQVFAQELQRYDFDCKDTKLTDTLYAIANRAGKGVVINGTLPDTVLTTLPQVTVNEALTLLSKAFNFNWTIDNNVIIVTPSNVMTQTKLFKINYANLDQIQKEFISLNIPEKNIHVNPNYNTVSIDGTSYMIEKVEKRLAELDVPVPQIYVVAQVVEVNRNDALKIGFNYSLPGYDNSVKPFRPQYTITSSAEKIIGSGNILARPSVTTLNGQKASVLMGSQVPVFSSTTNSNGYKDTTVIFKDVGVKLDVIPTINNIDKKLITLEFLPSVSSIEKWITTNSVTAPQIATREADTMVRIESGKTIIIGGLINQSVIESLAGIPGLMKIPFLGKLFQLKNRIKEQSEVFILVTPYLLNDEDDATAIRNVSRQNDSKIADSAIEKLVDQVINIPKAPIPDNSINESTLEPIKSEETDEISLKKILNKLTKTEKSLSEPINEG